nr:GLPGLI family protein [uncultured Sediminibacterium sp.]
MYKITLCIFLTLFSVNYVNSQDKISLLLEFRMVHVVDTTQRSNPRITPCMLLAGSRMSSYDDYYRSLRYLGFSGIAIDRVYEDPYDIQDAVAGITIDQIFIDISKQELITGVYLSDNLFAIKEPLPILKWTIQPLKKRILKHECQMATTSFKGRFYTAWFATDIPISAGPWKLNGLPGIILAANDDKNEISFTCTKIAVPEKSAPTLVFPKKVTFVSLENLEKTKKALADDPKAKIGMSDSRRKFVVVTASPTSAAAMQYGTKQKPRLFNNPIEKN